MSWPTAPISTGSASRVRLDPPAATWGESSSCVDRPQGAVEPGRSDLNDRTLFELLRGLSTEARNPRTREIDLAGTREVLEMIHAEDRTVLDCVQARLDELAILVDHIVDAFRAGGRLLYVGAGTSGRLGVLDAAECPPTFSTDPATVVGLIAGGYETLIRSAEGVEDREEEGVAAIDAASVGSDDVVVGISASRRTPFVRAALREASSRGAFTAFLVCNSMDSEGTTPADLVIEVVTGPEAITGSTRMKAALSQKMMLTMITTAAMVRWGKTYENLMVDVAPTSEKLVQRARGLVMELGGVDYDRAAALLELTGSRVKPAVLMAREEITLEEADRRLAAVQGHLRGAVQGRSA
ncbi:N-acetylmuramic acid 6-phosphate etherase [bacterium]|nr:MAG: N-acetylmuramic acid 6-phosphate etherase [bacterium]